MAHRIAREQTVLMYGSAAVFREEGRSDLGFVRRTIDGRLATLTGWTWACRHYGARPWTPADTTNEED